MGRVVHFEIYADDTQRAAKFYGDLFGWTFHKFEHADYWLVTTGPKEEPGIDGGLQPRPEPRETGSPTGFVCVVDVDDIDAAIAKAKALGAPEVDPKTPIPGIGWSAYFKDTEGNIFGVYKNDETAA
jgi:uncharacterized protein